MYNLTAAMHKHIFAVGLLGGKSAQATSESAAMSRHRTVVF